MTRRSKTALVLLLAVLAVVAGVYWSQHPREQRPTDSLQSLLEGLEEVAPEARAKAELALSQRGPELLPVLLATLRGTNAVPVSTEGAGSRSVVEASFTRERMRRQAIRAFEVLGEKGKPVAAELARMVEQTNQTYAAARALAGIGAVDLLGSLRGHERTEVRTAVASALGHVSGQEQQAVLTILDSVGDSEPAVRAAAMGSLGQLREAPERAVPLLVEGLKDQQSTVRLAAAKSLGKYGVHAERALPALEVARQDNDRQVRRAVRQAIELINLEKP